MKVIAVFSAILAVSSAQILYNGGLGYAHHGLAYNGLAHPGLTYSAVAPAVHHAVPVATKTQYHAQDELGQASFGHSEPTQTHHAVRDAAGGVRGSFSYIGAEGIPFTTNYIADHHGYRVSSNALPVAPAVSVVGPVDTPEVVAAKIQHAAAHAEVRSRGKRGLVSAYGASPYYGGAVISSPAAFGYGYSAVAAAPATFGYSTVSHAVATPAVVHAAPAIGYSTVSHAVAAPAVVHAAPALTYSAAAIPAVRHATLTKVVNNPGHAVSYRVD